MPLKGPTKEDERKLHAEINQVGNQRFLLTTGALTLFGVFIALMVPKDSLQSANDTPQFQFALSAILSLLLLGIYFLAHQLKNTMRIFTSYLIETKKSGWELDWRRFRSGSYSYFVYSKSYAIVFLTLNAFGFIFPYFVVWIYHLRCPPTTWLAGSIVIFVITELLIYLMSFEGWSDGETKIFSRWEKLNKGRARRTKPKARS
jgi:hypothetical protein